MLRRFAPKEQTAIWILAAVGFVSRIALAFRSDARIATRPYIEDAFYVMSCARQLALGRGFSVDGLHPTNGVQPLICLLYTPCFYLTSDKWIALRLTFVVTGLIEALGVIGIAHLLARLQRNVQPNSLLHSAPFWGALLWVGSESLLLHSANGLETGLYGLLIITSVLYYQYCLQSGFTNARAIVLGILLGLTVLARIDGVFLVLGFGAYEFHRRKAEAVPSVVLFGLTALLISLPWWLFNYRTFGSLMPISGQSEALGSKIVENIGQSVATIADILAVVFHHPYYGVPTLLHVLLALGITCAWIALFRRLKLWKWLRSEADLKPLIPLLILSLAVLFYYNFLFNAPHFIPRYLHPLRLLCVIVFATIAPQLFTAWQEWSSGHSIKRACSIGVPILIGLFNLQRYAESFTVYTISDFYRIGKWAEAHNPARVGMDQSGTASFVSDNVINLDGKVNSDALHARQHHQKGEYIAQQHFEYLADWPEFLDTMVNEAERSGVRYMLVDSIGKIRVDKRVP